MKPISSSAEASNFAVSDETGLGPKDGFNEENGIVISSLSPDFWVGISHCHEGDRLEGPNVDRFPSDRSNL